MSKIISLTIFYSLLSISFVACGSDNSKVVTQDKTSQTGTTSSNSIDGSTIYARCITCHLADGTGTPGAFPPLAGSEWVNGDAGVPIRIVLHGMQGPVSVAGNNYNGVMLPYGGLGEMNDEEIAAVLTYIRSSFGNNASSVSAGQVAEVRSLTSDRNSAWTADELKDLLQ